MPVIPAQAGTRRLRRWTLCGSIGLPRPHLRPAQQRKADVTMHVQLLAVVGEPQPHLVGLAVVRVEDLPAIPLVAVLLHAPHDGHAFDRLVVALAFALVADGMMTLLGEQHLLHHALQRAVGRSGYLDDGFRPAGFVVHLGPGADRGVVGDGSWRLVGGDGGSTGKGSERDQRGGEQGTHGGSPLARKASRRAAGQSSDRLNRGLWHNWRLPFSPLRRSRPCLPPSNPASAKSSRASLTRTPALTWPRAGRSGRWAWTAIAWRWRLRWATRQRTAARNSPR